MLSDITVCVNTEPIVFTWFLQDAFFSSISELLLSIVLKFWFRLDVLLSSEIDQKPLLLIYTEFVFASILSE